MNPYNRFGLVSSSVTAALILAALAVASPEILKFISQFEGPTMGLALVGGGAVIVMVVFWMAFTEVIVPTLFRLNWVRKVILGRYYVEGTWLQAEKGMGESRIAVIDIQPDGKSFTFSGYALDENLNVNSNVLLELSRFDWPFLTYKYRNSLSDGADGQRDGIGEIQFEMNRSSARRYNGFSQYIKKEERVRLEGAKLVRNSEVKRLRTLDGREEIVDHYWDLFFGREARRLHKLAMAKSEQVKASRTDEAVLPEADRRKGEAERPLDLEEHVIPRRRVSDWSAEDAARYARENGDGVPPLNAGSIAPAPEPVVAADVAKEDPKALQKKAVFDARHVL
jgi:hypothetical protein